MNDGGLVLILSQICPWVNYLLKLEYKSISKVEYYMFLWCTMYGYIKVERTRQWSSIYVLFNFYGVKILCMRKGQGSGPPPSLTCGECMRIGQGSGPPPHTPVVNVCI